MHASSIYDTAGATAGKSEVHALKLLPVIKNKKTPELFLEIGAGMRFFLKISRTNWKIF